MNTRGVRAKVKVAMTVSLVVASVVPLLASATNPRGEASTRITGMRASPSPRPSVKTSRTRPKRLPYRPTGRPLSVVSSN